MKRNILLVEDEEGLLMTLGDRLEAQGYVVEKAETGLKGLEAGKNPNLDLIVLDLMLPGMDGLTICKTLRTENVSIPIIMLTAKSQLEDKVVGLKLGADDYLTKPFEMPELLARIEAQLRRTDVLKAAKAIPPKTGTGLIIDLKRGYIDNNGVETALLAQEIKLLDFLYQHQGEIVSRETLLQNVWDYESDVTTRTVDVHIARLRQKLGDVGDIPQYILTIRGIGYKFIAP